MFFFNKLLKFVLNKIDATMLMTCQDCFYAALHAVFVALTVDVCCYSVHNFIDCDDLIVRLLLLSIVSLCYSFDVKTSVVSPNCNFECLVY